VSTQDKVKINTLPTGVPGLDEIVGGGFPEFSFNIIAGAPGSGKTTLAHQFVFANATPERPALYFTVLGESAIKMLRYQQQYTFFDPAMLPGSSKYPPAEPVALRLLAPQRGLFATVRSKSKNKSKSKNLVLLSSLPQHRQFEGEHTPGILKVLLPPRQSRGISLFD